MSLVRYDQTLVVCCQDPSRQPHHVRGGEGVQAISSRFGEEGKSWWYIGMTRDHGVYITLASPERVVSGKKYAASRDTRNNQVNRRDNGKDEYQIRFGGY